jgi:hypothetical protein
MKIRNIVKQFDTIHDFGIKNLIVGGCSFTYNNHDVSACTWPYYLKDLGGFEQVYDFSMVGGGNIHTRNAMIYGLEKTPLSPQDSLVIVQWAGNDRDDYIVDPSHLNDYPFRYYYEEDAVVGITGGQAISNLQDPTALKGLQTLKNHRCRSIENFVAATGLYHYLQHKGYRSIFFEYRDYTLPGRDHNFDPTPYLDKNCRTAYNNIMTKIPDNFYRWCLYHDLMESDDFHPSPDGHLEWTRQCFLPFLQQTL